MHNHTTGAITGGSKDLLQPLIDRFKEARESISDELNEDPAHEFTCDQVQDVTNWLLHIVQAMNEYNRGFSKLGLSTLSEEALESKLELAREASRHLILLLADRSTQFNDKAKCHIVQFAKGNQSKEIKDNLQRFIDFLNNFGVTPWLGELVTSEFSEQSYNCIKLIRSLQSFHQAVLPGCASEELVLHCRQCGKTTKRIRGYCASCNLCPHRYAFSSHPQGCPSGCNTGSAFTVMCQRCLGTTMKPRGFCSKCGECSHGHKQQDYLAECPSGCCKQTSFIEMSDGPSRVFDRIPQGYGNSAMRLRRLAEMALALAEAWQEDASVREEAVARLERKMDVLNKFAGALNDVQDVLRFFLVLRAVGKRGTLKDMKAWISRVEAEAIHKQLEQFRDEASEEKAVRRMDRRRVDAPPSASSWGLITAKSLEDQSGLDTNDF